MWRAADGRPRTTLILSRYDISPLFLYALQRGPGTVLPGFSDTIYYTHSSLLRTLQEIFGVGPLLGDAAQATDLSDLFKTFP